jgi:hypothetical protein
VSESSKAICGYNEELSSGDLQLFGTPIRPLRALNAQVKALDLKLGDAQMLVPCVDLCVALGTKGQCHPCSCLATIHDDAGTIRLRGRFSNRGVVLVRWLKHFFYS